MRYPYIPAGCDQQGCITQDEIGRIVDRRVEVDAWWDDYKPPMSTGDRILLGLILACSAALSCATIGLFVLWTLES